MCKHVAATLYGIGARLDAEPELLFRLRKVDAQELIARAGDGGPPVQKGPPADRILDASKLTDVFGIDLAGVETKSRAPREPVVAAKAAKRKGAAPEKAKVARSKGKAPARRSG
jgi:uncharacterized Zn finger protein